MKESVTGCAGRSCPREFRERCSVHVAGADDSYGYHDMDEGWTCAEYQERAKAETEDDDGLSLF
jgi:hypothetical protein